MSNLFRKFTVTHLLLFIFITSSFDIFLNDKIYGFTIRTGLVLMIIFIVVMLYWGEKVKKDIGPKFLGLSFLSVWIFFLIAFVWNTNFIGRNIGYIFWLFVYVLFVYFLGQYSKNEIKYIKLIKYYIASFELLALLGIVQFCLMYFFEIEFYLTQMLTKTIPRANGFSYEPSYYSSYLIIGWTLCFHVFMSKSSLKEYFKINRALFLITTANMLSTSKMGIAFMVGLAFIYIFSVVFRTFINGKLNLFALSFILLTISSFSVLYIFKFHKIQELLRGSGIAGTSPHSAEIRMKDFKNTIDVFLESPIIGYSLGGIPSAIAALKNVQIVDQDEAKNFEGLNIFAEVLAASGIVGFLFFIIYLFIFLSRSYVIDRYIAPSFYDFGIIHKAIFMALIMEFAILILNQNILRSYLWIHIALLNYSYFVLKSAISNNRLGYSFSNSQ